MTLRKAIIGLAIATLSILSIPDASISATYAQSPPEACPATTTNWDKIVPEYAREYPISEDLYNEICAAQKNPAVGGKWSKKIEWPHVAIHMANLPDGKILTWSSAENEHLNENLKETKTAVWTPPSDYDENGHPITVNQHVEITLEDHNAFCSSQVLLSDGRVLANGGARRNNFATSIFDPSTNTWEKTGDMKGSRYYPTSVALPDDRVYTAMGEGSTESDSEIWSDQLGWLTHNGANWDEEVFGAYVNYGEVNWWPQLFLAPNGNLLHLGPTPEMHWVQPNLQGSQAITVANVTDSRDYDKSLYAKHAIQVMYDKGKILSAGGWESTKNNWNDGVPAEDRSFTIEISGTNEISDSSITLNKTESMKIPRKFHVGTLLPDGRVLVTGGNTSGKKFSDDTAIFFNEIWDPADGTWSVAAPIETTMPRTYHQTALLMLDGRVLVAGGNSRDDQNSGEYDDDDNNGIDFSSRTDAQIWSPPYLYDANGNMAARPVIQELDADPVFNREMTLTLTTSEPVSYFSMIKMSSNTHAMNTDLRYLRPAFTKGATNQYTLTTDEDENVLTPGYWMLFALDESDVPSKGKAIHVPPVTSNAVRIASTSFKFPITLEADGKRIVADTGGVSMKTITTNSDYEHSEFILTKGLADPACYSFQSRMQPNKYLRHEDFKIYLHDKDTKKDEASYAKDATFCARRTINGKKASEGAFFFEAKYSSGGYYLHRVGDGLKIIKYPSSESEISEFIKNAEFTPNKYVVDDLSASLDTPVFMTDKDDISLRAEVSDEKIYMKQYAATVSTTDKFFIIKRARNSNIGNNCVSFKSASSDKFLRHAGWNLQQDAPNASEPFVSDSTFCFYQQDSGELLIQTANYLANYLTYDSSSTDGRQINFSKISSARPVIFRREEGVAINIIPPITDTLSITRNDTLVNSEAIFSVQTNGADVGATYLDYTWDYGDGSALHKTSSGEVTHTYTQPGLYTVSVTASNPFGERKVIRVAHLVYENASENPPSASSTIISVDDEVWVVNPDNDKVTVISANNETQTIDVQDGPWALAKRPGSEQVWVINKNSASISIINSRTKSVSTPLSLPYASYPHGIVFSPNGSTAYVALEGTQELLVVDTDSPETSIADSANRKSAPAAIRHLSINDTGSRVYASRFITPVSSCETRDISKGCNVEVGGEVFVFDTTANPITTTETITIAYNNVGSSEHKGPGLPNYLGPLVISPSGSSAWIPSKQDNILRGTARNGLNLTFDQTVRAISSKVVLSTTSAPKEQLGDRIDHDNSGVATQLIYGPKGGFIFTALETSNEVGVSNAYLSTEIHRIEVGAAPQGLTFRGNKLYVHNFMDRSVSVVDLTSFFSTFKAVDIGQASTVKLIGSESLASDVYDGKKIFYDATDPKMARDSYISCASCHNEGGQDGRVWDLTGFGEGLRNTTTLIGKGNPAHGLIHWTGNFNERQEFEKQIRTLNGGTGFIRNEIYDPSHITRGQSTELDHLDAYLHSLDKEPLNPYSARNTITSNVSTTFKTYCSECHSGNFYTDSNTSRGEHVTPKLHDIGSSTKLSGQANGAPLVGFDTPSLISAWETAPYLHDGSAATLVDAINKHSKITNFSGLTEEDKAELADFIKQLNRPDSK